MSVDKIFDRYVLTNNLDAIKYCLDHGEDPNRLIFNCTRALTIALASGNGDMAILLLDHGADISLTPDVFKSRFAFDAPNLVN